MNRSIGKEKYKEKQKRLSKEISRNDLYRDISVHEKEIPFVSDDFILAAYET